MRCPRRLRALVLVSLSPFVAARGQDGASSFDTASALHAAAELGLGGRPLFRRLFENGWPTNRDARRLTLEDGDGAFRDGVAAYLGSGLGLRLSASSRARASTEDRVKLCARAAGFSQTAAFDPVFMPLRRGDATFKRPFSEDDPATWAVLDKAEGTSSLRGTGLAIYASALFAEQELMAERKGLDGFLALCALESAVAAMHELRTSLLLEGGKFVRAPDADKFSPREQPAYFPSLVVPHVREGRLTFELAKEDAAGKSRLGDQAALLLGLSQLARTLDPSRPALARFVGGGERPGQAASPALFDRGEQTLALDLAVIVLKSSRTNHLDLHGSPLRCASTATPEEAGAGIRAEDLGLYLLALEAFVTAVDGLKKPKEPLLDGRKGAIRLAGELGNVLERCQADTLDGSFVEVYTYDGSTATKETERRPLATQGLVVRGLLAASRLQEEKRRSLQDGAAQVFAYLEKTRWDAARSAYVDEPRKPQQRVQAADAAAILGALRDMALATSDQRYLLRHGMFLRSLRKAGFIRSETSRQGETGAGEGDSDGDGVKFPRAAGIAPVALDVVFP